MKAKFVVAVLLTALSVSLVAAGVSGAHQTDQGSTVYLPIVATPCSTSVKVSAYASASSPVVHVGDTITLTGAIVNECARLVGVPYFTALLEPQGILSETVNGGVGYYEVPIGTYRELTQTLVAVRSGPVTITGHISYESVYEDYTPSPFYIAFVWSDSLVVRVLPNP